VHKLVFFYETKDIAGQQRQILNNYSKSLEKQTNVYALAKRGLRQINLNQPAYACATMKRATQLDDKYRDAWFLLGTAYLKNGQTTEAIQSLEKAAALDPIYAPTFKILASAYNQAKNEAKAAAAQNKYDFLTK